MKVSVAIVTFNSESVIKSCLDSLLRQSHSNYEILIYDNCSYDNTCKIIEQYNDRKIKLVRGNYNKGFGYALNRLSEIATGEILASLNPDTVVDRDWIKSAIRHFEGKDIGMVSSRVVFMDRPKIIDSAGHLIYPDGLNRGRGHNKAISKDYLQIVDVAFPSGSAGFYRMDIFSRLGGIDESLFLFGDDTDIGIKFRLAGYRCIYEPESIVYHLYSHSTGIYSDIKAYFVERNRLQILIKYFPINLIINSFYHTFKRILMHNLSLVIGKGSAARYLKNGSIFRLYKLMSMAYIDTFLNLIQTIDKRKRITSDVDINKMRDVIKKFSISAKEIALND